MASPLKPQPPNKQILDTLRYFDKYDYPLTAAELKYWSGQTGSSPLRKYYFLPGRARIVSQRIQRTKISLHKWQIATQIGEKLQKFPTIAAIFVTGALAMNNCPVDDDIDLMVVTAPYTLWLTRLLVVGYLNFKSWRRLPYLPHHTGPLVSDKICDNLWLDLNHLAITQRNLRTAHEILQAKVLWDRNQVHDQFLRQNLWVKKYLPNAYKGFKKNVEISKVNYLWWPINVLFFVIQYLYMLPKKTSERVGLGYAFFHPRG